MIRRLRRCHRWMVALLAAAVAAVLTLALLARPEAAVQPELPEISERPQFSAPSTQTAPPTQAEPATVGTAAAGTEGGP